MIFPCEFNGHAIIARKEGEPGNVKGGHEKLFSISLSAGIFEVEAIIATKKQTPTIVSDLSVFPCAHALKLPYFQTHVSILPYCHVSILPCCVQVQWEWQENDGAWKPYSSLDNRNIEVHVHPLSL